MTASEIIAKLGLEPLPWEGGWFRETYRAALRVEQAGKRPSTVEGSAALTGPLGERSASTAIYYLLTPDVQSAMHVVPCDEVFHFYLGDPVEMLQLHPDGRGERVVIGSDLAAGHLPQVVVPGGVWQGARLREGGRYALMGTTVAPGFEFEDLKLGDVAELSARFPDFKDDIEGLAPRVD